MNGPARGDDHVFLRSVAPHIRLADHAAIHRVTVETFRTAGVDRREGRHPVAAPQRRVPAAARGGPAADDLGGARPRQPGIDQPVHERRPGPSARVRAAGPDGRAAMNGHGFTSAFAPQLDAYLAFKQNMGFYGTSRIWYLKQFDAYCTEHDRTVFDRDTVEGWVSEQLARSGRYRSWMSYIRDVGRWLQAHGHAERLRAVGPVESPVRSRPPLPADQARDRGVLRRRGAASDAIPVAVAGGRVLHPDALVRAADRRNPRSADRAGRPARRAPRHHLVQGQPQPPAAADRSRSSRS